MEVLIYNHSLNELQDQDNPTVDGDECICVCLVDKVDEYETYDIIESKEEGSRKLCTAYGRDNALRIADLWLKKSRTSRTNMQTLMKKDIKERLDKLKEGDYIAFPFAYYGGKPNEIIVDNITSVDEDRVLVHFVYGHHSLSEFVKKSDIIAIGDKEASGKIEGWSGTYQIINPGHPLLNDSK